MIGEWRDEDAYLACLAAERGWLAPESAVELSRDPGRARIWARSLGAERLDELRLERELGMRGAAEGRASGERFRPLHRLEYGTAGESWTAEDRKLQRTVVLKFLAPGSLREARVWAGLCHPNVLRVFDVDESAGCMVLEHAQGEFLGGRILSDREEALVTAGLRSALEHARALGVGHGNLVPENILLTVRGYVLVLDWGI